MPPTAVQLIGRTGQGISGPLTVPDSLSSVLLAGSMPGQGVAHCACFTDSSLVNDSFFRQPASLLSSKVVPKNGFILLEVISTLECCMLTSGCQGSSPSWHVEGMLLLSEGQSSTDCSHLTSILLAVELALMAELSQCPQLAYDTA